MTPAEVSLLRAKMINLGKSVEVKSRDTWPNVYAHTCDHVWDLVYYHVKVVINHSINLSLSPIYNFIEDTVVYKEMTPEDLLAIKLDPRLSSAAEDLYNQLIDTINRKASQLAMGSRAMGSSEEQVQRIKRLLCVQIRSRLSSED